MKASLVVVLGTSHLVHDPAHSRLDTSKPELGVPVPPHLVERRGSFGESCALGVECVMRAGGEELERADERLNENENEALRAL